MLKFRPIVFADEDFRAFKYVGAACAEGQFCSLSAGSTTLNVVAATPYSGVAPGTLPNVGGTVYNTKAYFPIFRENPDPETVSATINQNDYVVGFTMRPGNEFEVHYSQIESGTLADFTAVGQYVCLGSNGKVTPNGGTNATSLVLGVCMGTFGAKYVRVKVN